MVLGGRWGLWLAGGEGGLECPPEARQWSWGDLFLLTAFFSFLFPLFLIQRVWVLEALIYWVCVVGRICGCQCFFLVVIWVGGVGRGACSSSSLFFYPDSFPSLLA